jgi:magnesium chelatase family protein
MHTLTLQGVDCVPLQVHADLRNSNRTVIEFAGNVDSGLQSQLRAKLKTLLRPERMVTSGVLYPACDQREMVISFEPSNVPVGAEVEAAVFGAALGAYDVVQSRGDADNLYVVGEVGLDGRMLPLQNALAYALRAHKDGRGLALPADSAAETSALGRPNYVLNNWADLQWLVGVAEAFVRTPVAPGYTWVPGRDRTQEFLRQPDAPKYAEVQADPSFDFRYIKGQAAAKRAAEIAVAGGHNMLLMGPPGEGKSLLTKSLPSILPPLSGLSAIEVTHVHRMKGLLSPDDGLQSTPPFVQIDRNTTLPALLGGGQTRVQPGALTLANHGVLYLDELHQANSAMIEALRQPLEDGYVVVQRARWSAKLPARFIFVSSSNPCRCGWLHHPTTPCRCTPSELKRYQAKLSGPLLDRISVVVNIWPLSHEERVAPPACESSAEVRERVVRARARMAARGWDWNALIPPDALRDAVQFTAEGQKKEQEVSTHLGLSTRAADHLLRVARTVADLRGRDSTEAVDVEVAASYCNRDTLFNERT